MGQRLLLRAVRAEPGAGEPRPARPVLQCRDCDARPLAPLLAAVWHLVPARHAFAGRGVAPLRVPAGCGGRGAGHDRRHLLRPVLARGQAAQRRALHRALLPARGRRRRARRRPAGGMGRAVGARPRDRRRRGARHDGALPAPDRRAVHRLWERRKPPRPTGLARGRDALPRDGARDAL